MLKWDYQIVLTKYVQSLFWLAEADTADLVATQYYVATHGGSSWDSAYIHYRVDSFVNCCWCSSNRDRKSLECSCITWRYGIVGIKNLSFKNMCDKRQFEGIKIAEKNNVIMNLSTKPRVGFTEINVIMKGLNDID